MSQNETYYDYDANFCNLFNTFNGSGLNFSEPVVTDCLYIPKNKLQCHFASNKPVEGEHVKLPFIQ